MKIQKYLVTILKNPWSIWIFPINRGWLNNFSDKIFLKIKYRAMMGKRLNIDNPKTFNEKLQWLKLNDHNKLYTTLVDKYLVKKYVAGIIGEQYIIPTLGVWNSFDQIDFNKLPNKFVLKCTHDSGGVVICKDKKTFNYKKAESKLNFCLKRDFYLLGREWPYKNVKRRIIAEALLESKNVEEKELLDYKFMCFNGKCRCSFVCSGRFEREGLCVTFFDKNWNKMPFERHYPASTKKIKKPEKYDLMIELAEKISKNIPFARIDFYEIDGRIYFGEITLFPGNGMEEFRPEKWDRILGDWITLPKKMENSSICMRK